MRTAAVAVLVTVAVGVAGYGLQAAGLRRTPRANAVAANAATWLLRYRFATSTLRLDGRTMRGRCFHGWIEGRGEHPARGTILVLDNGTSVRAINPSTILSLGPRTLPAVSALDLAGCTQVLGSRLAALAQFDNHMRIRRTSILGRPAFALEFQRLTLLVSTAKGNRPLGVTLGDAASRIWFSQVPPHVARALENYE